VDRELPSGRRRLARFVVLAAGLAGALYFGTLAPKTQHVRVVLGDAASQVSGVRLVYVGKEGEALREAEFHYAAAAAPRVVAHEPELPDGEYLLKIDLESREGRRTVERRVTLGGGSTQIDVSRTTEKPE
jgi:hypothetical protein